MRNLVLLLLLANVIFFAWNRWVAEPPADSAIRLDETVEGALLDMAATEIGVVRESPRGQDSLSGDEITADAETAAEQSADAAPEAPGRAVTAAGRGGCVSLGPFDTPEDAAATVARLGTIGNSASMRTGERDEFLGHWVQVRDIPGSAEPRRQLALLRENGIEEAYLVPEEDGETTISLGLFSERIRAERLERRADTLGVDAEIVRHSRGSPAYWADTRLLPGQELSALRGLVADDEIVTGPAARCPPQR